MRDMSPELFNVYTETIMREIVEIKGFVVGDYILNNLRYADDAVLLSSSKGRLQTLLGRVVEASKEKGPSVNRKKTECMVVSKKSQNPGCKVHIDQKEIKQVTEFNYLGSIITEDGRCEREIKARIGMAKEAFERLKN